MASTPVNDHIRYEPDEKCAPLSSFVVGIQGIMLVLPPAISIVVINVLAAGQDEEYLTWAVFSALVIVGIRGWGPGLLFRRNDGWLHSIVKR